MRAIPVAVALLIVMAGTVIVADCSDMSSADSIYGTPAAPLRNCDITQTTPDFHDLWVYPGSYVRVEFLSNGNLDFANKLVMGDLNGFDYNPMDVTVLTGHPTATSEVELVVVDTSLEEEIDYYITVHVVTLSEVSVSTGEESSTVLMDGEGRRFVANAQVTEGSLPTGMSLSSDGVLTGRPSSAGTAIFTVTGVIQSGGGTGQGSMSFELTAHVPVNTTTSVSTDMLYVVEGNTAQFVVAGDVEDGSTYYANLSTTGGMLSKTRIADSAQVLFTAPQVNGTTVYLVTVESDVPGTVSSRATVTVVVVDALTTGIPSTGQITSS